MQTLPNLAELAKLTLLGLSLAFTALSALAYESVRDQEIAQCLPGEMATWGDGQDQPAAAASLVFVYVHTTAPAWFTPSQVMSAVQAAAAAWSQCGVAGRVVQQAVDSPVKGDAGRDGTVLVQWGDSNSRGNFGLADLGKRTLALGPAAFQLLKTQNPAYDASQTLQMVISHEMGHFFGLIAHSRRCVDVTSYYSNGQGEKCFVRDERLRRTVLEYRSVLPTACDIQRCMRANSAAP